MASYDPMDVDTEGDESEDYGQTPKPSDPTAARRWVPMPSGGKDRGYQQKQQASLVNISGRGQTSRYQIGAMTSSRSGVSSVGWAGTNLEKSTKWGNLSRPHKVQPYMDETLYDKRPACNTNEGHNRNNRLEENKEINWMFSTPVTGSLCGSSRTASC